MIDDIIETLICAAVGIVVATFICSIVNDD